MRFADLDMDGLRALAAVADAGGFTAAGDRLGRTQSAISIRIKRLEGALGRRLFERNSRSLALTRDGELLLAYARRILELNDETVRRFAEPDAAGDIRLGAAEYFVPHHLPAVLRRFAAAYPRVQIEVKVGMSSSLIEQLDAGALDLVIAKRDDGAPRGRVIRREPLRWVAAAGFDRAADPLPVCALPPPCVFRARGLAALKAAGRAWRLVYTSESVMGVVAAVQAGLGLAVTGESIVTAGLHLLSPADGFPPLGEIEIALFGETARQSPAVASLVSFIEDSLVTLGVAA
jgi:DNA-binding transcriptional LysR family regulator